MMPLEQDRGPNLILVVEHVAFGHMMKLKKQIIITNSISLFFLVVQSSIRCTCVRICTLCVIIQLLLHTLMKWVDVDLSSVMLWLNQFEVGRFFTVVLSLLVEVPWIIMQSESTQPSSSYLDQSSSTSELNGVSDMQVIRLSLRESDIPQTSSRQT